MKIIIMLTIFSISVLSEELQYKAFGTYDAKKSKAEREKNCRQGFQNLTDLNFNTDYRLIGKLSSFRISSLPSKSPQSKISGMSEISYNDKDALCTSELKLTVPSLPVYSAKAKESKSAFIDSDMAVVQYSQNLNSMTPAYLGYLSCFQSRQAFTELIKISVEENPDENKSISLNFPAGSVFTNCGLKINKTQKSCSCLSVFHKKGLKKEIQEQLKVSE